jgi:Nif-specific regulatory protein
MMAEGRFREDLYYRLSVFPISVPDLAHRTGDVLLLAEHFMERMARKYGKKVTKISPPAVNMLLAWKWPGNVRELENCMERAVLTASDDTIRGYNLPPSLQTVEDAGECIEEESGDPGGTLEEKLIAYEKRVLEDALQKSGGNRSAAGRLLGVTPRMMNYRIAKCGCSV